MAHSFVCCEFHCVWSTKERRPLLSVGLRDDLFPFILRTALNNNMRIDAVGGTENHVHALLSIPATRCLSDAIQLIKGTSSRWINGENH
jgi:putative transposase